MSNLQAERGRNVVSTLAKGRPMCRVSGILLGWECRQARAEAYIPIVWKIDIPRTQWPNIEVLRVLGLCGMDFSIFVQTECAMFGPDQGVGA